jgi:hypothetical protein
MGRTRKVETVAEIENQTSKVRYIGTHPYLQQTVGTMEWNVEQHSWLYTPSGKIKKGMTGEQFRVSPQSVENE